MVLHFGHSSLGPPVKGSRQRVVPQTAHVRHFVRVDGLAPLIRQVDLHQLLLLLNTPHLSEFSWSEVGEDGLPVDGGALLVLLPVADCLEVSLEDVEASEGLPLGGVVLSFSASSSSFSHHQDDSPTDEVHESQPRVIVLRLHVTIQPETSSFLCHQVGLRASEFVFTATPPSSIRRQTVGGSDSRGLESPRRPRPWDRDSTPPHTSTEG